MLAQTSNNFISALASVLPHVILITGGSLALLNFLFPTKLRLFSAKRISIALGIYYLLFPLFLTLMQYHIWAGNSFTAILLKQPLSNAVDIPLSLRPFKAIFVTHYGYFLFYVFGRFWLPAFITLGISALSYGLWWGVKKFRPAFCSAEEVWLICAATLAVGWPACIILYILMIIFILLNAVIDALRKKTNTRIGYGVAFALAITLICGKILIEHFHVAVLNI